MRDKGLAKRIADERVHVLTALASKALHADETDLARRYAKLANEIITHYRLGRAGGSRKLCKSCGFLLEPGVTCDVRMASSKRQMIYKCRLCGREMKIHY